MQISNRTLVSGGALGVAVLMVGSLAIAAKSRPVARARRNSYPTSTVHIPNKAEQVDPDGINIRLGRLQKRATQSASRVVEASRKRSL